MNRNLSIETRHGCLLNYTEQVNWREKLPNTQSRKCGTSTIIPSKKCKIVVVSNGIDIYIALKGATASF